MHETDKPTLSRPDRSGAPAPVLSKKGNRVAQLSQRDRVALSLLLRPDPPPDGR